MARSNLRIYKGPEGRTLSAETEAPRTHGSRHTEETVSVKLGEILPALTDAMVTGKSWLKDFENDEVTLPLDLYEVILAYQQYQRQSA